MSTGLSCVWWRSIPSSMPLQQQEGKAHVRGPAARGPQPAAQLPKSMHMLKTLYWCSPGSSMNLALFQYLVTAVRGQFQTT
jgi:hypothetical protein